jgi:hypothetical protein
MDMIWDDDAWNLASSKLVALGTAKLPVDFVDLHTVEHFHEIIDLFERATKKTFPSYRIDPKRLRRKPVPTRSPLQPYVWSDEKYCPAGYMTQQFSGFFNYIHLFRNAVIAQHKHIMQQAEGMKKGYSGELDTPQPSSLNISIGTMTNSTLMAQSPGATIINKTQTTDPEFIKLIQQIKNALPSLEIEVDEKKKIAADITTIESQIESPAPKYTIISESFNSIRAVLEGIVANTISTGLLTAINAFLSKF